MKCWLQIILKTGWRGDSDFVDPMCGSGTFLIEAALIGRNIAPGIYRKSFAFEKWKNFDPDLFEAIYNDESMEKDFDYQIFGSDIDPKAVEIARANVKNAGLSDAIRIEKRICSRMKKHRSKRNSYHQSALWRASQS